MEGRKEVKISVVIPVYNGEKYLEESIESLRNQTLREVEIICVDDGSKDRTKEILSMYEEKDDRIRLFNQNHKGAGYARNYGFSKAIGEYVIFLDADDIFEPQMLEKIVGKGDQTKADVIVFGAKRYDDRTGKITDAPWYLQRELIPKKEVFSRRDMDGEILSLTIPSPWTKAVRRTFLAEQKIEFQNLPNSNDVYFSLLVLAVAERVSVIREDLLLYRTFRQGSIQNQRHLYPLCFLEAYEAAQDELKRRGVYSEVEKGFCFRVLSGCVHALNTIQDEKIRWKVIETLAGERIRRMELLDFPDEYYGASQCRNQIKGLKYALDMKKELEKAYDNPEATEIAVSHLKKAKVTVIVPVYNTEKYLRDCMDGLLEQTLRELEIICVDDGSTDGSLGILQEYVRKDSRISVWHQKNSGQSAARNLGISKASGEYIYFMDSDDFLQKDALEQLYERSKIQHLDILYFDGSTVYEDEDVYKKHPEFEYYYIRKAAYPICCPGQDMMMKMKRAEEYRVNPGIQFFKRNFLISESFRFYPGIIHEDNDFTFRTMLSAERVGYLPERYFNRRVRERSTMTEEDGFRHIYGYFKTFLNMYEFLEENAYPEEMTETLYQVLYATLDQVKKRYDRLTEPQKYAFIGLRGMDRIRFRFFVENENVIYTKLHRVYAEKSEINRKLQITYGEKFERGLEIKRLKKELENIKKSKTYRLARVIGFPIRVLRKAVEKLR